MEKEIVWTKQAEADFWDIVTYLKECWPPEVLTRFEKALLVKTQLLQKQPSIGFKSHKHSRFRKTFVTKYYAIIYTVKKEQLVILRVVHVRMK
ncbi:type II toxin-antitoxin system RelE/ParE family toxin [Lacibacter luteus]|uniref:Type II toxin-antitoxin system RelE/ParE family toxin n=1 Tax=Lacibacter luteus TaxID=2508719 RepID=A0A4Q1CFD6_9BACT|nr:type II toxin-antitoxin system RelE/ParE family toxin [Lacibacter luteus]RXK58372.1 type II toxin-antitoxin system RelE/ParE family toxin [Lacibacter luteus]